MEVFRISRDSFRRDLSGEGSRQFGGRWNRIGTPALYTSTSRSLALLEILVHTSFKALNDYYITTIRLPDDAPCLTLQDKELLPGWDAFPAAKPSLETGDAFFEEGIFLGMYVPSCLVPEEKNLVLNPLHPLMKRITITDCRPLIFNERFKNHFK